MKSYAQNQEDLFFLKYFNGFKGNLLSIGENNGVDLSNAKLLIDNGWSAWLVEPGEVFYELEKLHQKNKDVHCYKVAIGTQNLNKVQFFESGAHVKGGSDKGLVSTFLKEETERWKDVEFKETAVDVVDFETFYKSSGNPKFDFISIDAEGFDWQILQQIDLTKVGCRALCIEHNGDDRLLFVYRKYCTEYGMKEALINGENIIFVR